MSKSLFKNYNYDFDKNEKKILVTFCKQAIKQMSDDNKYYEFVKSFQSIIDKIDASAGDSIKLTKDEKTKLTFQLKENIKFIQGQVKNAWFIKKWLYKSMLTQYSALMENHFKD
ncbi:MAG: hypothetical protein RBS48_04160 [Ignavibacteriaceae bacterium]|jgi:hypothetical protein|nr:hypothetical protein [Ignavibacteriaceae bacterium]